MKKELILFLFICPLVFFYVFSNQFKKTKVKSDTYLTLDDSFEKLQGVDTEDWNYIQTKKDFNELEKLEELYQKNKRFQFAAQPILKVPKTIHLIWLGPKPFPREYIDNIRSWIAHHPDWNFKFWTDRRRPPPCNGMDVKLVQNFEFQFLKSHFDSSKNWAEKADILRYEVLYQEGGLFIDYNVKCSRPFHNLHSGYDFFACLEMPHEGINGRAITTGNAVIGARRHHPVIKGAIGKVIERWEVMGAKYSGTDPFVQAQKALNRTFIALSDAMEGNLNRPENTDIIFPANYFFPVHGTKGFYAEHFHGTAMQEMAQSQTERYFANALINLRKRDAKILRVELFSLFALLGCFGLYFLTNKELKRG
ncbi:MAG: hypothetical protein H7A38_01075 [Chlamydiales bacterium]|nr:hypothetical protein [Chlamydiales bacterium]